jgi:hypothetical protein
LAASGEAAKLFLMRGRLRGDGTEVLNGGDAPQRRRGVSLTSVYARFTRVAFERRHSGPTLGTPGHYHHSIIHHHARIHP